MCLVFNQLIADSKDRFVFMYSVMQSDGNSFCGDVVLNSFNMVYSDEDSI